MKPLKWKLEALDKMDKMDNLALFENTILNVYECEVGNPCMRIEWIAKHMVEKLKQRLMSNGFFGDES